MTKYKIKHRKTALIGHLDNTQTINTNSGLQLCYWQNTKPTWPYELIQRAHKHLSQKVKQKINNNNKPKIKTVRHFQTHHQSPIMWQYTNQGKHSSVNFILLFKKYYNTSPSQTRKKSPKSRKHYTNIQKENYQHYNSDTDNMNVNDIHKHHSYHLISLFNYCLII